MRDIKYFIKFARNLLTLNNLFMKKLLLSLLCLVGFITANAGRADLETMDITNKNSSYLERTSTDGWKAVNAALFQNSSYSFITAGSYAVCLNGKTSAVGSLTSPDLTGGIGALSLKYGLPFSDTKFNLTVNIKQNGTVVATTDIAPSSITKGTAYDFSYEFNIAGDFVIEIVNNSPSNSTSNKDRSAIWDIEWTEFGGTTNPRVAKPVITPEGGEVTATTEIAITTETTNAAIYYTIDGTTPAADNGTLYTAPFTVSETCTVKAVGVLDGYDNSLTASVDFIVPFEVANIAAFITAADTKTPAIITGAVTVVAQIGDNLIVQDESGKLLVYGTLANTYKNGDQLTNIKGAYKIYGSVHEMVDPLTIGEATAGTAVEPQEIAIEEVAIDNTLDYIKLTGISIEADASSAKKFNITDETGTVLMYNQFNLTEIPTGDNYTIIGLVGRYNATLQVWPIEFAASTTVAQTPVITPEGGELAATDAVTITCETEGASIYYTLDGTEPSASSTLYTEPFAITEACTVKAIAVKAGMENSAIAEAVFTLRDPNAMLVTYDFTQPGTLNPVQTPPALGKSEGLTVNDVTFTAGATSLVASKGEATTDCRIWAGSAAYDLRTYTNSTITITATGAAISKIVFEGSKIGDTYVTADNGTISGKIWTPAESDKVSSVVFTATKTTNINTISVDYKLEAGLEDLIISDDVNAPVEFYNLQGVKIANPENGFYIRVQGGKATKVLVK